MRILQLHNHHASKGGAMEVLAHEAELLTGAGHQVEQFTLEATERMNISGARAAAKAVWNREAGHELDRRITAFHPDVVHVHTPFPLMSPVVFRVAHHRGVPAVTTLHSYRYSCVAGTCFRDGHVCEDCVGKKLKLAGLRHRCYHDSLAASGALTAGLVLHRSLGTFHDNVARYLTLTDFSRRLLIRDGFPAERIVVKPNSVPDPGFVAHARADERRIVFVGRLIEIKGVRALLDAWASVPAGLRLVIAGDGPLRALVEERASRDPSIEFVGWVDEADVLALMGAAEAVVGPSEWYEGLPLVILRSLAVGTPVVVSDVENFSEDVVEDDVGWTFRVGDAEDLAKTLSTLVADPDLARSRREVARGSYAMRYSPAQDLRRLEEVYRTVAVKRPAKG
jgi:glycosyltransferase involved in cell wall biosynthesis